MARQLTLQDIMWIIEDYAPIHLCADYYSTDGRIKKILCYWTPQRNTYAVRMAGGDERTFDDLDSAIEFYNSL